MRVYMKRNCFSFFIVVFVVMVVFGSVFVVNFINLDVNFMVIILEMMCNMKLVGGIGFDMVQELIIGNSSGEVCIDDVRVGIVMVDFKLVIVECLVLF